MSKLSSPITVLMFAYIGKVAEQEIKFSKNAHIATKIHDNYATENYTYIWSLISYMDFNERFTGYEYLRLLEDKPEVGKIMKQIQEEYSLNSKDWIEFTSIIGLFTEWLQLPESENNA